MRKGHSFEHEIDKVLKFADKIGCHCHKNHPNRTVSGEYLEGEPFDYEIFLPYGVDVFDAKEVDGKEWHMKQKDIRQCNELMKCKSDICRAYFLLLFNKQDVVCVDAEDVANVLKGGHKTVKKELGYKWDLIDRLKELSFKKQTNCQT